jgi:hypothetical protein
MIKVNENFLSHKGEFEYLKDIVKTTEVSGENYTNTKREIVKTNFEDARKTHFIHEYEYEFKELNYKITIEDFNNCAISSSFSENTYVARLRTAFENKFLDKRIKDIEACKNNDYDVFPYYHSFKNNSFLIQEICRSKEVNFVITDYGFNNCIYYSVTLETFVQMDYELYPRKLKEVFKEFKNKNPIERANYLLQIFSTKLQLKYIYS